MILFFLPVGGKCSVSHRQPHRSYRLDPYQFLDNRSSVRLALDSIGHCGSPWYHLKQQQTQLPAGVTVEQHTGSYTRLPSIDMDEPSWPVKKNRVWRGLHFSRRLALLRALQDAKPLSPETELTVITRLASFALQSAVTTHR